MLASVSYFHSVGYGVPHSNRPLLRQDDETAIRVLVADPRYEDSEETSKVPSVRHAPVHQRQSTAAQVRGVETTKKQRSVVNEVLMEHLRRYAGAEDARFPSMAELRILLVRDGLYPPEGVPSVSSLTRATRRLRQTTMEKEWTSNDLEKTSCDAGTSAGNTCVVLGSGGTKVVEGQVQRSSSLKKTKRGK